MSTIFLKPKLMNLTKYLVLIQSVFCSMEQELTTFITVPQDSDFTIYNIPFGVVASKEKASFAATIIGNTVIDLKQIETLKLFDGPLFTALGRQIFANGLNEFISLSKPHWTEARKTIQNLFRCGSPIETNNEVLAQITVDVQNGNLCFKNQVTYELPCTIGEYTDFYSSRNHAFNIGSILRGPGQELQQNWMYLPVGYHGRRSTIVVSGTDLVRPWGQTKAPTAEKPSFGVCKRLDFELEIGAILGGPGNRLGEPIKVDQAEQSLFGLVLLNDWSARDIQGWEYIPLGPFTSKNLQTTISPWIVTIDALEPYRVALSVQDPEPFVYLREKQHTSFDLQLEVYLGTAQNPQSEHVITSNFKHLYWSISQQIAHHSITGCQMKPGDILGSGTISGETKESRGCLMEYTWNGKEPLAFKNGQTRTFLEDGDSVELRGFAGQGNKRVGFGGCKGSIQPALNQDYFQS